MINDSCISVHFAASLIDNCNGTQSLGRRNSTNCLRSNRKYNLSGKISSDKYFISILVRIIQQFFFFLVKDVVYALAHATGRTGRFTLTERWRNNERLLAPQEHPLKVESHYFIVLNVSYS